MNNRYSRWSWHISLRKACLRISVGCVALLLLLLWLSGGMT